MKCITLRPDTNTTPTPHCGFLHCILSFRYSPLGGWAKGGTGRILKDPTVNAIGKVRKRKEMRFYKYDHTLTLALVPDLV